VIADSVILVYKEIMLLEQIYFNLIIKDAPCDFIHSLCVVELRDRKPVLVFSLCCVKAHANTEDCSIKNHEVVGSTSKNYEQIFKNRTRASKECG